MGKSITAIMLKHTGHHATFGLEDAINALIKEAHRAGINEGLELAAKYVARNGCQGDDDLVAKEIRAMKEVG